MESKLEELKKLLKAKKALVKKYWNDWCKLDDKIDKFRPVDKVLHKGDVVYTEELVPIKITAVNKDTYKLEDGATISKDGLTNYRGFGFDVIGDWQYYYDKEHRDILDIFDKLDTPNDYPDDWD